MKAQTLKSSGAKMAAVVILCAAGLALTNCFYTPGVSGDNARTGIALPKYVAANTVSLALIVGGPGMDPIYTSYTTIPPSISIEVPSGLARTFTVLLNSPSATLRGVATVDLQPGESKDITVNPTVAGTQIIVPDNYNSRLVQISDMSGTGWTDAVNYLAVRRRFRRSGPSICRVPELCGWPWRHTDQRYHRYELDYAHRRHGNEYPVARHGPDTRPAVLHERQHSLENAGDPDAGP